jgi:hypothetical protein
MIHAPSGLISVTKQAAESSAANWISMRVASESYAHDCQTARYLRSPGLAWQLPRGLLSVSGLVCEVQEMDCRGKPSDPTDLAARVSIPSSIRKVCSQSFEGGK